MRLAKTCRVTSDESIVLHYMRGRDLCLRRFGGQADGSCGLRVLPSFTDEDRDLVVCIRQLDDHKVLVRHGGKPEHRDAFGTGGLRAGRPEGVQSDNADARRGLECVVRWRVVKTYASVLLSGRTLRNATFHCYRRVRRCPPASARRDRASVPALFASLIHVPVRGRYLARMSYRGIVVGRHATSSMSREGL